MPSEASAQLPDPAALPHVLPAHLGPAAWGGFSSRSGGESIGPYADATGGGGLNLGPHVGDDRRAVGANRARVAEALGVPVAWMRQVHGASVHQIAGRPDMRAGSSGGAAAHRGDTETATEWEAGECDGLVAPAGASIGLGVMVADCVPVLMADEVGNIAVAHVGRAGLLRGVVAAAVHALHALPASGSQLYAAIGPSICGRCYEVPAEMRDDVGRLHPRAWATTAWDTPSLNLPAAVRAVLETWGAQDIHDVAICTYEDERYYSYRRAGRAAGDPATGRFAGLVRRHAGVEGHGDLLPGLASGSAPAPMPGPDADQQSSPGA